MAVDHTQAPMIAIESILLIQMKIKMPYQVIHNFQA